jgi:hypothetical protein
MPTAKNTHHCVGSTRRIGPGVPVGNCRFDDTHMCRTHQQICPRPEHQKDDKGLVVYYLQTEECAQCTAERQHKKRRARKLKEVRDKAKKKEDKVEWFKDGGKDRKKPSKP